MPRVGKWSRREALKGAAAVAAVGCKPRGSEGEGADAVIPGSVDTVILIMMENRSFDHWFGARALLEGRLDEDGLTSDMVNLNSAGEAVAPFHADAPCLSDPPHSWSAAHTQWDEGSNDGFVREYARSSGGDGVDIMGYLTRDDLPISWALADHFLVCDRYFCSVMGPTWPNRIYGHAGANQGMTNNSFPEDGLYSLPTVWKTVEAAGIEWAYYYSDVPFIAIFRDHYDQHKTKLIDDFFKDAAAGRLPPVVWIDPAFTYNDDHPPKHHALGELFLAQIYEALRASPQWERMMVLVTFDEHGGFFDHVPPPTTDDDFAEDGFDQLGFRVPSVVMGPWVKQGVDSSVYEHSSWLKFICDTHGIEPWTKRIAAATSLGEALDQDRMASGVPLDAPDLPAFSFDEENMDPSCEGGNDVISAVLLESAERARLLGYPVRLDKDEVAAPFRAAERRRRLIG